MNRLILCVSLCVPALTLADDLAEGKRWWKHVEFLADDKLEGRNTGSAGHRKAAEYVAQEFERSGLKAAGVKGYIQPVQFDVRQIDEPNCRVEMIVNGGAPERLKFGEEVLISTRAQVADAVEAEAVFVGYGLTVPDLQYDDLKGIDVKGKIVVFLTGGPRNMPGNLKAHFTAERSKFLKAAGAIGTMDLQNPKSMDIPWARQAASRFQPSMSLADPRFNEDGGMKILLRFNPEKAEKLFAGTGHTFAEILAAADADKPLPKFPLGKRFRVKGATKDSKVESQNVVAMLEGADPVLKNEYVVLSAHLDHLGTAQSVEGDRIFNGAMDNASGIAWLLETARRLKESGMKPKRSLIFVAVTGEEKGLQGSKYFAGNPSIPGAKMVADINMDMVLPLFPLRYLEVQGLGESTLGGDIRTVCSKLGIEVQFDKEPDRNRFIRSDQYSFIKKGVPALAFKFGWVPGTPEEKIYKAWYKDRYHGLSDDLSQPVDLAGAGKFTQVLFDLLSRVANADQRPRWNADSFFKRFAN